MKKALVLMAVLSMATAASALTVNYGWEDGQTILGSYGNLANPLNQGTVIHSGSAALQITEAPHGGTPQAYLAYIEGLQQGDVISASFFGFDDTPDLSPSLRIWAHYAVSGDVTSYAGSAGGSNTYSTGIGWEELSYSWTFDDNGGTRDALVIEARLYSYPSTDDTASSDYWIDDLTVIAPDCATITTPGGTVPEPATMALLGLGGLLLSRRRK